MTIDAFPEAVKPKLDENRRYTTRPFMHFIKRVAGVEHWDLDVAADMESHHAVRYLASPADGGNTNYGYAHVGCPVLGWPGAVCPRCSRRLPIGWDGLKCSWLPNEGWEILGGVWRIFINPPFDNIGPWLAKVWDTIDAADDLDLELRIAFVMPGNRTEQPFWQDHVEPFLAGHQYAGRYGYQLVAHSPRTRQFYGYPGNPEPKSGQAEWPSVVLVWRRA